MIAVFSCFVATAQQDTVASKVYAWNDHTVDKDSSSYRIQFCYGNTSTLALLEIHATELDPHKSPFPPHANSSAEVLIIVKEGLLKVTVKGNSTVIGPGGVALIMPGDEYSFENTGNKLTTYYSLRFNNRTAINIDRGNQAGGSFSGDWENWPVQQNDKGERREVFDRFTALFQKMELHVTTLNEGMVSHNPHKHAQEEIILIRSGRGEMLIGDKTYAAASGDLVYLSSGILHNIKNTGKEQLEYFALQWQ
jgi:(S)-ureidoglycine aminohydrolase